MRAAFVKMEGAGNDFVVIDERAGPIALGAARVASLADRRRGIGFDQLVRLRRPTDPRADLRMVIQNSDGTDAGACGNASRCVALLLDARLIETSDRLLATSRNADGSVTVDMGPPAFDAAAIGLTRPVADTTHLPLAGDPAGCAIGNPHATFFVDDLATDGVVARGAATERDSLFADRVNVGFARMIAPDRIRLRVWERGAGLTLACGTGACATLVNAHRRGLASRRAHVALDGGMLGIEWREADDHVLMTGPAAISFIGSFEL